MHESDRPGSQSGDIEPGIVAAPRFSLGRRRFLTLGAVGVGALADPTPARLLWQLFAPSAVGATPPNFTRTLLRPDDQLWLRFEFVNLSRAGNQLNVINGANPALIRIVLPSQHTAEETIPVGAVPPAGALGQRAAADTRLVFLASPPVPFTTAFLLDLAAMVPNLDPRANAGGVATGAPSPDVTAIEIPEGLVLTPGSTGRFIAPVAPVTFGDVTEVWRARLGIDAGGGNVNEPPSATTTVRAIFEAGGNDTFDRALDEATRQQIVNASSKYSDLTQYPNHEAINVKRLWLSPLAGGFLDVTGEWTGGTGSLVSWLHRAATGRDIEVRVVQRGYLAPFGHAASIVTVAEREFRLDANGDVEAVLVEASYLTLATPKVDFPRTYQPNGARRLPFASVTVDAPPDTDVAKQQIVWNTTRSIALGKAWIVTDAATGNPLVLSMTGVDHAGTSVPFELDALFVSEVEAYKVPGTNGNGINDDLVEYFADTESFGVREAGVPDVSVCFAPDAASGGLATTRIASNLRFKLELPAGTVTESQLQAARQPAFFPILDLAFVRDATVDALQGGVRNPFFVSYTDAFKTHGFGSNNAGGTFLQLSTPFDVAFGGEGSALAAPDFSISTFSLALGTGPLPPFPNTNWDPAAILSDSASFLGNLLLKDLVKVVAVGPNIGTAEGLPHIEVNLEPTPIPDRAEVIFSFCPEVDSSGVFVVADDFAQNGLEQLLTGDTRVCTTVTQIVPFDGSDPSTNLEVSIGNFALAVPEVAPFFAIYYRSLTFVQPSDGPRDLKTQIEGVRFTGDIAWLEPLQAFLGDTTGSFGLDVSVDAIDAQLALVLPDLSFGIVNVHAPTVGIDVNLPLDGQPPVVGLSLGTRDDPIAIAVMGIGGSAWFKIELEAAADPFRSLELELAVIFEAEVSFIIGRAGVRLSIGAGLKITANDNVILTAFVSLAGVVEILGFEVLSAEATAALTYNVGQGKLKGSLHIVLASLFGKEISESVSVDFLIGDGGAARAAGRFAGPTPLSLGSTSFVDRFPLPTWQTYCGAFA